MTPALRIDDLSGLATVSVPTAGRLLSLGRDAAYAAAARGEIPTLRLGRRLVVPVPRLLALIGANPEGSASGPASPAAALTLDHHGDTRDDLRQECGTTARFRNAG